LPREPLPRAGPPPRPGDRHRLRLRRPVRRRAHRADDRVVAVSAPYRACYWTDGRGEIRLTGPEHASLSDSELEVVARAEAEHVGLDLSYGHLIIGDWTD